MQVACLSNLRQLNLAFIAYANANRGWFPSPAVGSWGPYPEDWLYWQDPLRLPIMPGTCNLEDSPIFQYLGRSPEVLKCPLGVLELPAKPYQSSTGPYRFSYSINVNFTAYGGTSARYGPPWRNGPPCPINRVFDPCRKILTVEEDSTLINDGAWCPLGADPFGAGYSELSVRHDKGREYNDYVGAGGGRTNVGFADGHCEYIPRRGLAAVWFSSPSYRGGPVQ